MINILKHRFKAFTLAEMMILLLITSIVLAAAIPMAVKQRAGEDINTATNIWKDRGGDSTSYINPTDIYTTVQIGTSPAERPTPRDLNYPSLIVNTNSSNVATSPQIMTKKAATILGEMSMDTNRNIALGYDNFTNTQNLSTDNIAIGLNILKNSASYDASQNYNNIGIGVNPLANNSGNTVYSIAIGSDAGNGISNTSQSIFLGRRAGYQAASGSCIYAGSFAGSEVRSCALSIMIGLDAGTLGGPSQADIFIGHEAAGRSTGSSTALNYQNIAIGYQAMKGYTRGGRIYNIAIGSQALYATSGNNNIAIGAFSCTGNNNGGISGSNKVCIGYQSGATDKVAGPVSNPTAYSFDSTSNASEMIIGKRTIDKKSKDIFLSSFVLWGPAALMTSYSDIRKKNIIKKYDEISLEKFRKIKTYVYSLKKEQMGPQVGIIAQEMKEIIPQSVTLEESGYYTYKNIWLIYATVNVVKELNYKVQKLTDDIKIQAIKIVSINDELKLTEKELKTISKQNKNTKKEINEISKILTKLENNRG